LDRRTYSYSIYKTIGKPLNQAHGPKELLRAIIHATVGLHNLFLQGYEHRDVSLGNIMIVPGGFKCDPPTQLPALERESICYGILIDGDQAIPRKGDRALQQSKFGTLPFMSLRLLFMMAANEPTLHTPLDDLESVVHTLGYLALDYSERHNTQTTIEKDWFQNF
ncbi:hypothetical protein CALVIDRAFT_456691, partial [Calocera viscosa TUFC12733]